MTITIRIPGVNLESLDEDKRQKWFVVKMEQEFRVTIEIPVDVAEIALPMKGDLEYLPYPIL